MKKKNFNLSRLLSICTVLFLSILNNFAQNNTKEIRGSVKDDVGEQSIGTTVNYKGTQISSLTDISRAFNLKLPANGGISTISYIGYNQLNIKIEPNKSDYEIILRSNQETLNEFAVTALGIKREEPGPDFSTKTITR